MPDSDSLDGPPSPSRRRLLSAAAGCLALAGCARPTPADSGRGRVCEASLLGGGDDGPIERVDVLPGETVVLEVTLDPDAEAFDDFSQVAVFDAADTLEYVLPRASSEGLDGPRRVYQQALGPFPQNGRLRVQAVDRTGTSLGSTVVEFNCYAETGTPA